MERRDRSSHPKETPGQTVNRFIGYTVSIFRDSGPVDIFWETEMHRLFGSEELLRVTKDKAYMGVKGLRQDLETALATGGLPSLKAKFLVAALGHTQIEKLNDLLVPAFERVISFE